MSQYSGCELPEELYYDLDYVWVRPEADDTVTVGITDPAQSFAGRILHVRIKAVGKHIRAGRQVATLESGKWAGGVPLPFDGEVVARNEAVLEMPHLLNIDPYRDAWIARLRPLDAEHALDTLHTGEEAIQTLHEWIDRYGIQCMRCSE
ncbi:glycine cleavage system protein H [Acidihalobacter ferrooxydans]|uniref:Glycine cleavage system H protein n=1 Tax=Acidihalobacter ferrooxydans TaxID=1765967 RepID=A0A1P8UJJ8_9GAMM|nr:glycine cleavage system protein H [Acidihalobacter ferrooxydans]APZ43990.1 glycine cleavage system protein H [Acidihalobacter ferrooxydans]